MATETRDLPAGLTAAAIKRDIVEAYVRDLEPIRPALRTALDTSDLEDLYAPIWTKFGGPEAAAIVRSVSAAIEANNRRLLEELAGK